MKYAPFVRIVATDGKAYPAEVLAMPQAACALVLRIEPRTRLDHPASVAIAGGR